MTTPMSYPSYPAPALRRKPPVTEAQNDKALLERALQALGIWVREAVNLELIEDSEGIELVGPDARNAWQLLQHGEPIKNTVDARLPIAGKDGYIGVGLKAANDYLWAQVRIMRMIELGTEEIQDHEDI